MDMKNLIEKIFSYLLDEKSVPEDLIFELAQDTIRILQDGETDDLPQEFWNLQHYLNLFWHGRKYESITDNYRIYQMGQLLSYVNIIRDAVDNREKKESIEEYAQRYNNRFLVYKAINDKPGINHRDLAMASGISTSALSQFISKTKWDGYYTFRVVGREKYYYLTENGKRLYQLLEKRHLPNYIFKMYLDIPETNTIDDDERFAEFFNLTPDLIVNQTYGMKKTKDNTGYTNNMNSKVKFKRDYEQLRGGLIYAGQNNTI